MAAPAAGPSDATTPPRGVALPSDAGPTPRPAPVATPEQTPRVEPRTQAGFSGLLLADDGAAPGPPPGVVPSLVDTAVAGPRSSPAVEPSAATSALQGPFTSSIPERSADNPGERGREHDRRPGPEAASALVAGRTERAHDGSAVTEPSAATADDVVRQIVPRISALPRTGRQEIVLRLDPPALGTVHIEASLDGRELTLRIRAGDAGARDLLEQGLPQLRRALEQEGLAAGHVSVQLGLETGTRHPPHGAPFARPTPFAPTEPVPRPVIRAPRAAVHAVSSMSVDLWV